MVDPFSLIHTESAMPKKEIKMLGVKKTLSDLKSDAKQGKISGEMVLRCGLPNVPDKLKGIRRIVSSNSVGITFLNNDGHKSELRLPNAALTEYTGCELILYSPAERPYNEKELAVMAAWKKIEETPEFIEHSTIDALSDGSRTYWQQKSFFEKSVCPYLFGSEEIGGLRKGRGDTVIDTHMRGEPNMEYKIWTDM